MAATTLPMPFTSAILSERWILIDQTCQIMFVGEGDHPSWRSCSRRRPASPATRPATRTGSRAFRFNPALDNGGMAQQLHVPRRRGQPAQRQHVQADLLRSRAGHPRREQRADHTRRARAAPGCGSSTRSSWSAGSVSATSPARSATVTGSTSPSTCRERTYRPEPRLTRAIVVP